MPFRLRFLYAMTLPFRSMGTYCFTRRTVCSGDSAAPSAPAGTATAVSAADSVAPFLGSGAKPPEKGRRRGFKYHWMVLGNCPHAHLLADVWAQLAPLFVLRILC